MALPLIFPPGILPCFFAYEHQVEEGETYASLARGSGHSRKRGIFTTAPRRARVAWRLHQDQMTALDSWFEDGLAAGERHFTAAIADQIDDGLRYFDAVWEVPYQSSPQPARDGVFWSVSGSLLLFGDGQKTRPTNGVLRSEIVLPLTGSGAVTTATRFVMEIVLPLKPATQFAMEVVLPLNVIVPHYLLIDDTHRLLIDDSSNRLKIEG